MVLLLSFLLSVFILSLWYYQRVISLVSLLLLFADRGDLLPLTQRLAVLNKEKQSFVRTQDRAKLPAMFRFSLILSDI